MSESVVDLHPSVKANPEDKSGLYCFKDMNRVCGADCMAYSDPPEGPEYIGKQWAQCILLVSAQRTGRHLVALTNIADKIEKRLSSTAADARRASGQTPPPRPVG